MLAALLGHHLIGLCRRHVGLCRSLSVFVGLCRSLSVFVGLCRSFPGHLAIYQPWRPKPAVPGMLSLSKCTRSVSESRLILVSIALFDHLINYKSRPKD